MPWPADRPQAVASARPTGGDGQPRRRRRQIGGDIVAKSAPDGYTLMLVASNHAQNPALHSKLPFDPLRDFAPVSLLLKVPNSCWCIPAYR